MRNSKPLDVFVFGAGASRAEGAPTTVHMLSKSLETIRNNGRIDQVAEFLKDYFFIENAMYDAEKIPTFEELLTLIDTCLLRKDDLSKKWNYKSLTQLRNNLVYCIAEILERSLLNSGPLHNEFVYSMFRNKRRNNMNTAFISFNYDILLDNALLNLYVEHDYDLEYEVDFRNQVEPKIEANKQERLHISETKDWWHRARRERAIYLLKPHGSLNWVYCPNCNTIKMTKREKGVLKVWRSQETCENDKSHQRALIIPPTWQKMYDNAHLTRICLRAEDVLRRAKRVFFIGYSFSEADVRSRYLFKKFLYREDSAQPKILVVLKDKEASETESRYVRLFGKNVIVLKKGFKDFVGKPDLYAPL